jgi:phenylalanyl-tRNA synthetase beta chain
MKININWLKELVDFKETASQIAEILTGLGLESEEIDVNIISVETTANRGDCLSMLGLARELSAKLNLPFQLPESKIKISVNNQKLSLKINEDSKKFVPRFSYRIINGIKIGPSPKKIVEKIESYGFRPINNVVDITNLIMIELGQPLHAFDAKKLGGALNLRLSSDGEKILTLDGKEHTLKAGSLVGENQAGKLVDLCGIMGGFYSEVDVKTTNIILQAAIFDPINIRTTAKYLNHTTDASYRYERGVDQAMTLFSLDRATDLILKTAKGQAAEIEDLIIQPLEKRKIKFDFNKINKLLGTKFSDVKIKQSLEKLGFKISNDQIAIVPSFRLHDIYFWQDLAEETLREIGYSNLKPEILPQTKAITNQKFSQKEFVKDTLAGLGFSETLSYSFISRNDLALFNLDKNKLVKIKKPLSLENEYFRPSLYLNVLKQVTKNPWFSEVKFFEIGRVVDLNKEEEKLTVLVAGKNAQKELQGVAKALGIATEILEINPSITQKLKIKKPVFYFEIPILKLENNEYQFKILSLIKVKTPSNFPPAQIDLAFIADKSINASEIEKFLNKQENIILAELFDEFASDKFGKDKKNIAYHLWLEKMDGALSEIEIKQITDKIVSSVNFKFSTNLR